MTLMRRSLALIGCAAALIVGRIGYSRYAQAKREAAYNAALVPYKRDLTLGTGREQVMAYLRARGALCHTVRYGGTDGDSCEIEIAKEPLVGPDRLFCESWRVYVAFDFTSADKLREIHIRKIGTCL